MSDVGRILLWDGQEDSFYEHDMARRRVAKVAGECRLKWRGLGRGEPCEECEVVSDDR